MIELFKASWIGAGILPFFLGGLVALARRQSEKTISRIVVIGTTIWFFFSLITVVVWGFLGGISVDLDFGNLYAHGSYTFPLKFHFDRITFEFLSLTALLGSLIFKYCQYYLHREAGYARFFTTLYVFVGGMIWMVSSATLDLLFVGWEIVGVASFLLIGFYRDRNVPQRNALMAMTVYRVCDIGILMGAWMEHLVFHQNVTFAALPSLVGHEVAAVHFWPLFGLSCLVLFAASGKSAQIPFCSWLPRAMEGPTPSSAIFYGALSIHAGVFLLLRTQGIWSSLVESRVLVGTLGLLTAVLATLSGRVQSNIKAQIAYASIAQVGLMLVELALGWIDLCLLHVAANAMLRCYQLLVSPSVVAHLLRVQGAVRDPVRVSDWSMERVLPEAVRSSLYVWAFNEGYLPYINRTLFWSPLRRMAGAVHSACGTGLDPVWLFVVIPVVTWLLPHEAYFAYIVACLGCCLASFVEYNSPQRAWHGVFLSCLLAAFSIAQSDSAGHDVAVYLFGVIPAWVLGWFALKQLGSHCLRWHHGLAETRPNATLALFIAVLGLSGFPITSAFIGEDLLLHHAGAEHIGLGAAVTFAFVVNGITLYRLYSRLAFGQSEVV